MRNSFTQDTLQVEIYPSRGEMGAAAAKDIALALQQTIAKRGQCNIIFAAAPSQNEVLAALADCDSIDWHRVNAFHMDEYVGLAADAPQGFANFLRRALFSRLPFGQVHCLDGQAEPQKEARRYAALLREYPADIVVMGIGENGHIAFNDPPVARFNDTQTVKLVTLEEACRLQQVHDGCFAHLGQVPKTALTLTVPALMAAKQAFCIVPAATKAQAVYNTLQGPIGEGCPATALRLHPCARLYLDMESAGLL